MTNRLVNVMLVASVLMILAMFVNSGILFALAMPILLFSWMYLGALRNGKIGKGYQFSLTSVLIIWIGGFLTMNLLDTQSEPSVFIGGFPLATAIMVYIVWALPFFFGSYLYGHYFESDCIDGEELNQLIIELNDEKE